MKRAAAALLSASSLSAAPVLAVEMHAVQGMKHMKEGIVHAKEAAK